MNITLPVRLLSAQGQPPAYATAGDAGMDLRSCHRRVVPAHGTQIISTGIAVAIPDGFVGLVHPRSGLAAKNGITVLNAPGTIDSGYRGEIKVILHNTSPDDFVVEVGDRIAQLVIQEYVTAAVAIVDTLPLSERGEAGFGSTGVR